MKIWSTQLYLFPFVDSFQLLHLVIIKLTVEETTMHSTLFIKFETSSSMVAVS